MVPGAYCFGKNGIFPLSLCANMYYSVYIYIYIEIHKYICFTYMHCIIYIHIIFSVGWAMLGRDT